MEKQYLCRILTEKSPGSIEKSESVRTFHTKEEATAFGEASALLASPLISSYQIYKRTEPEDNVFLFALMYRNEEKEICSYLTFLRDEAIKQAEDIRNSPLFGGAGIELCIKGYLIPKEKMASESMDALYKEVSRNKEDILITDLRKDEPYPLVVLARLLKNNEHRPFMPRPTDEVMEEIYKEAQEKASVPPFDEVEDAALHEVYICHVKLEDLEYIPDPFTTSDPSIAMGYIHYAKEELERKYPRRQVKTYCEVYRLPVLLPAMSSFSQVEDLIKEPPEDIISS